MLATVWVTAFQPKFISAIIMDVLAVYWNESMFNVNVGYVQENFHYCCKKNFNLKESKLLPHMLTLRDVTRILITYNNKWSHFLHLLRRFHYFLWRIRILFLSRRRGIRYNLKHKSGFERKLLLLPEVSFEPQPRITALRFSTLHYQCTNQPHRVLLATKCQK